MTIVMWYHDMTGWWFGTIFIFPYVGNDHPNWLYNIFQRGSNHQPDEVDPVCLTKATVTTKATTSPADPCRYSSSTTDIYVAAASTLHKRGLAHTAGFSCIYIYISLQTWTIMQGFRLFRKVMVLKTKQEAARKELQFGISSCAAYPDINFWEISLWLGMWLLSLGIHSAADHDSHGTTGTWF